MYECGKAMHLLSLTILERAYDILTYCEKGALEKRLWSITIDVDWEKDDS